MMAKRIFSTVLNNSSNAGFQAWATELYNEIIAAGLVQTADTGQLSVPVSAARPGNATAAGYWIFRFNDALQATAPIFMKLEVGTSGSVDRPGIWYTVGTGSDGAGNITGVVRTRALAASNTAPSSTSTPYSSYINHEDGFFGMSWKANSSIYSGQSFIAICRTTDDAGDPTANGYFIVANGSGAVCGIWGGYSKSDTERNWCMVPFALTNSAVAGDYQVFKVYGVYPTARIVPQLVVAIQAELLMGAETGAVEVMDGVSRNYIGSGLAGKECSVTSTSLYHFAMLWS